MSAVTVRGLRKSYGDHEALRGIDFKIEAGEVFGLLGPNGAGKTTTVEILEGYRERSGGSVAVLGEDPGQPSRRLRERVGIVLQSSGFYPRLTALTDPAGAISWPARAASTACRGQPVYTAIWA